MFTVRFREQARFQFLREMRQSHGGCSPTGAARGADGSSSRGDRSGSAAGSTTAAPAADSTPPGGGTTNAAAYPAPPGGCTYNASRPAPGFSASGLCPASFRSGPAHHLPRGCNRLCSSGGSKKRRPFLDRSSHRIYRGNRGHRLQFHALDNRTPWFW